MAAAALSLPLSRIASNQGSIAIKEHQRAKRRPSYGAASSSPPSIASLTRGSSFGPTTITMGASGAPLAALAVGAGRPLDPTFVAATVSASTSSSFLSTSPSTSSSLASSPTPSTRALPTSDEAVPVTAAGAAAAVAVADQAKKAGWLKTIIPDKLIHYDPSRDPRLHSL